MTARAVLDTNITLASIGWKGRPYRIRLLAESGAFRMVTSLPILAEISHVLRDYYGYSDETAYEWHCRLGEHADVVNSVPLLNVPIRDLGDLKFIECAVTGHAQFIVNRDNDLLQMKSYRTVQMANDIMFLNIVVQ